MTIERIEKSPHIFWLTTCGIDTYRRSPNHARHDTPWNAFNEDRSALVNTMWVDHIVTINDPEDQRERKFIKLGMRSALWRGQAIAHGKDARANLEAAIKERIPVFGFETEPDPNAQERGIRLIKHFYLDRIHQLKPVYGVTGADLQERLRIEDEFQRQGVLTDQGSTLTAILFELVPPSGMIPGRPDESATTSVVIQPDQTIDNSLTDEEEDRVSSLDYARRALPLLVAHVTTQQDNVLQPITYLHLAELLDRRNLRGEPWPKGIGKILDLMTGLIEQVNTSLSHPAPLLASVVVSSSGPNVGLPSDGVSRQWPGYEFLSREDKLAKVHVEYERILSFGGQWNDVLLQLQLPTAELSVDHGSKRRGAGESDAHKNLKRFVRENPHLCGAEKDWQSQEEFALRSGDEIDVMFKSKEVWIGVEVKSHVSDKSPDDYQRGLYQVVKYKAVLEAQAHLDHPEHIPIVHVLLVLEGELPPQYRDVATSLGIHYLERVTPVLT